MLRDIRDRLQLDRTLAFALGVRVWQAISGPITIFLIIRTLTLAEQGVYYGIVGILGIQAYFELGLLNVLVSHSGHEMSTMERAAKSSQTNVPDPSNPQWIAAAARMRDLIRGSFRWFRAASCVYVACAIAFGWYSLADSDVEWQIPLLTLVPIAAISVWLSPALSILEGAGFRDLVYRFRFMQTVLGSLAVWITLAIGFKLWALVIASAVQSALAFYISFVAKGDFFRQFRGVTGEHSDFVWSQQVLPTQWRVALIAVAFHFATQFFTVIVLMFHGDVEAAPLGMTLTVTTAIQMLALAWVQAQYPVVSAHHGAGEREKAGTIWRRTAVVSTTLLVLAFAALVLLIASLPFLGIGVERRFIEPWQVSVLGLGCMASHIASLQGFYVLSRRANPLLRASLIGAISTAAAVWIGGYNYSTTGVIVGYSAAMCLVLLPVHTFAYSRFRRDGSVESLA
jgi:O-antigen/teichoic acid export membrane protein